MTELTDEERDILYNDLSAVLPRTETDVANLWDTSLFFVSYADEEDAARIRKYIDACNSASSEAWDLYDMDTVFDRCSTREQIERVPPKAWLKEPPEVPPLPPLNSESEKPTPAQVFRLKKLYVREDVIAGLTKRQAGELIRKLVTGKVYHQPFQCKECGTTHDIMHHITYDEFKRRAEELRKLAKQAEKAKKWFDSLHARKKSTDGGLDVSKMSCKITSEGIKLSSQPASAAEAGKNGK